MNQRSNEGFALSPEPGPGEAAPAELDFAASRKLKNQLLAELRSGWEDGAPVRPEDLLGRWPGNPDTDPDVASLLFEDYYQRRRHGEQPTPEQYSCRFPDHQDSLASLTRQQDLLRSLGGSESGGRLLLALPRAGDELFGFRLCHELGRGSFARVFLAEQTGLAGRPVVVKVSAIEGDEPQTLAQLQHTHIVPIYSVHEDAAAGLRVVCMPYFGGASLSRVLEALWIETDLPLYGAQFGKALEAVRGPCHPPPTSPAAPVPESSDTSPLTVLAGLSYVRAAAWLVARLAEALQHAHQRRVQHRDLKPSNILLGSDGQPMLLDFNLSQNLNGSQAQTEATLGGTVAYMAPEHLRALAGRDPALVRLVDERADIYSLGMVLYEMLTGRRPFDQSGSYSPIPALIEAMALERGRTVPSLRERRPDVSWTLESIARKCLAPDAAERYQQAEHVAEDLRRYLEDRPLKYAPELSWRERVTKWVRRHPRLAVVGPVVTAAALLLVLGGAALAEVRAQLDATRVRAYEAEGAEARELMQTFVNGTERARSLLNTPSDPREHLAEGRHVCEQTLALYDILNRPDWQAHLSWKRLQPHEQRRLAEDARELLLLLAWAHVWQAQTPAAADRLQTLAAALTPLAATQLAPGWLALWEGGASVWRPQDLRRQQALSDALHDALALIQKAETVDDLEPSAALWQDRAQYLERLGDRVAAAEARTKAQALPPRTARDHYLLASHFARKRQHGSALAELKQALALNPKHYWSWCNLGHCYCERRDYTQAVGAYSACIALWPEFAWAYLNRGHALDHLGKNGEAAEDYTAALARDPEFIDAYINRGLLALQSHRPSQALADFDAAVARGRDDVLIHAGRGIALEELKKSAEADVAFGRAWGHDPNQPDMLLGYGFAVSERLPGEAEDAFLKVIRQQPQNFRALYGYAMLLARRTRDSEAVLKVLTAALQVNPMFVDARRARAVLVAHRQDACGWARQEIDWCVKAEPRGVTFYAAACVYALSAEKGPADQADHFADRAVDLLAEAFQDGYGQDRAAADTDLAALRRHPGYRRLLRRAPKKN